MTRSFDYATSARFLRRLPHHAVRQFFWFFLCFFLYTFSVLSPMFWMLQNGTLSKSTMNTIGNTRNMFQIAPSIVIRHAAIFNSISWMQILFIQARGMTKLIIIYKYHKGVVPCYGKFRDRYHQNAVINIWHKW